MIPAAFEYEKASSVEEAVSLLQRFGEDAKVLAGGHSLIPLMRLRLAQPSALVDINGVKELSFIKAEGGKLRIGAMTRHVEIQNSDVVRQNVPILAEIADEVGDNQVRNMGTIGGVLAHADSAGDYPTLAVMLEAELVTNKSRYQAKDFFKNVFTTAMAADEVLCEVVFPVANGPHKYIKFRRRLFDWAIVGAGAQKVNGGWRIGLTNVGPMPVRATAVEQALASGATPEQAAEHASDGLQPSGDLRASPDYKKHLARVLTKRAIQQAQGA
ncbi:MAG: xanthine dehydrogenase family protein subunit M [Chloroflexi bacterium]|nr:MAG: xanthine dehydrogenase family protein subunit M [Chloroflexota bacterium]TME14002.1 MAG: xanthine dehydrogenase family protein subunit M [Chloroflexota bacterium]TME18789.1 MAG: xanthine dehydrogenase family protein subunit M [Chloroflexota bacterium]